MAFNTISILIIFFPLLSYSAHVEVSRPLIRAQDKCTFKSIKSFLVAQAYSRSSHRGRVH
ncbi:hypothetical protein D8674_026475 [Pyrus ussuriensis x Pyrus communis]|uniref:Uncharacterized protein n=1 Tax=Pyrus ussuriensis x Pyrus communis TaxID=2448454 RepID=A0A5N5IBG7_9ROSA|nr:hypothetical protein D8674_026475 [Pyrus ussuriensis x Pyrus communis]